HPALDPRLTEGADRERTHRGRAVGEHLPSGGPPPPTCLFGTPRTGILDGRILARRLPRLRPLHATVLPHVHMTSNISTTHTSRAETPHWPGTRGCLPRSAA